MVSRLRVDYQGPFLGKGKYGNIFLRFHVQTSSDNSTTCYVIGTGALTSGKNLPKRECNHFLHVVSMLRILGALLPLMQCVLMMWRLVKNSDTFKFPCF